MSSIRLSAIAGAFLVFLVASATAQTQPIFRVGGLTCDTGFARNSQIGRGTLRGSYVGASGNVAVGVGLGAKVLIGGSRRTITLQPLSIEGQVGLNQALGVTNLVLR